MERKTHCGNYIQPQFGATHTCSPSDWQCDACQVVDLECEIEALTKQRDLLIEVAEMLLNNPFREGTHSHDGLVKQAEAALASVKDCTHDWNFTGENPEGTEGYFQCSKCGKEAVSRESK